MTASNPISGFNYAEDILSRKAKNPRLMTTLTYAYRAESAPVGPQASNEALPQQEGGAVRVPLTVHRHAEAWRVQTPAGPRYHILWSTTHIPDKGYEGHEIEKASDRLFPGNHLHTLKEAISILSLIENSISTIKADYCGRTENAYLAPDEYQTPERHFSHWDTPEPAKPGAQFPNASAPQVSP